MLAMHGDFVCCSVSLCLDMESVYMCQVCFDTCQRKFLYL